MAKQFDDLTRSVQAALKQEVKASRPSRNDQAMIAQPRFSTIISLRV